MPESNSLRIAVISDLHAIDDVNGGVGNSNIRVSDAGDPTHNPLDALLGLVKAHGLEADLLICPGDLCDKADPGGLTWAWKQLDDIAKALGAETLATTTLTLDLPIRRPTPTAHCWILTDSQSIATPSQTSSLLVASLSTKAKRRESFSSTAATSTARESQSNWRGAFSPNASSTVLRKLPPDLRLMTMRPISLYVITSRSDGPSSEVEATRARCEEARG
jgi:3',5'-cyclic AMP phosphodiesterase CpdA